MRLEPGQGDGGHVHQVETSVVVKYLDMRGGWEDKEDYTDLSDILVNIEIVEEDLVHSKSPHDLNPFYQLDADVFLGEIKAFAADGELLLLLILLQFVINYCEIIGDLLTPLLHQRDCVGNVVTMTLCVSS